MRYLNQKVVKSVFKDRKQITKEALIAIDRRVEQFLEKLATEPREKRIDETIVNFYTL